MERIGDRKRPLAKSTQKRIQAGLDKFKGQWMVIDMSRPKSPGKVYSITDPTPTLTARLNHALALTPMPFVASYYSRDDATSRGDNPLPTVPTENRHALVMPHSFISTFRAPNTGSDRDWETNGMGVNAKA